MKFNIDEILETLMNNELPKESDVQILCNKAKEIFLKEPNMRKINLPVTICGDIHGQFEDLKELFRIGGDLPETSYLFLGDYVDRGSKGVEVILFLIASKVSDQNYCLTLLY